MAKNLVDEFLNAFRSVDSELKLNNKTVLDFENELNGTDQEKMKVCRIMRNYIAHNDTQFVTPSIEQITFLNKMTTDIRNKSKTVKDAMKKIKTVSDKETIANLLPLIAKSKIIPMETDKGIYLVTKSVIIDNLCKKNKKIEIPTKRLPKYEYIWYLEHIENIKNDNIYIVTSDGTAQGTYMGILFTGIFAENNINI